MFTEEEHRKLAAQAVRVARNQPISQTSYRQSWLRDARKHITAANNIAWRRRLGMEA